MLHRLSDADLYAAFTAYLVLVMGRSPRTAESYIAAVRRTGRFLELSAHQVGKGDTDAMIRLLTDAPWALSTKRGVVVACRQFHYWGNVAGHWKLNGLASLKTPKVPRRKLPPISSTMALRALVNARSPIEVRIVNLGLYGGLRVHEQAAIDRDRWLRDRLSFIGKGNKEREVPVHPELAKVKEVILSKQPKGYHVLESTFWRFARLHDIRDVKGNYATTHSLRRTFGQAMYDQGNPWEICKKLLGHEADVTGQSYIDINFDLEERAVWSVDYAIGPTQLSFF